MIRFIFTAALTVLLVFKPAMAAYDANMTGKIATLAVYTEGDYIYVRLENQPTTHNGCNPSYFVIPNTIPVARQKVLLARLTLAYSTQETINIGYAANGDCAHGYIQLYRAG